MKQLQETFAIWQILDSRLAVNSMDYITNVLKSLPNQSVDISDLNTYCTFESHGICNTQSKVSRVYLEGEDIYLAVEESDKYNITEIWPAEMFEIAESVEESVNKNNG